MKKKSEYAKAGVDYEEAEVLRRAMQRFVAGN